MSVCGRIISDTLAPLERKGGWTYLSVFHSPAQFFSPSPGKPAPRMSSSLDVYVSKTLWNNFSINKVFFLNSTSSRCFICARCERAAVTTQSFFSHGAGLNSSMFHVQCGLETLEGKGSILSISGVKTSKCQWVGTPLVGKTLSVFAEMRMSIAPGVIKANTIIGCMVTLI